LAGTRVLGRAGIPVELCGEARLSAARASRYAGRYRACASTASEAGWLEGLRAWGDPTAPRVLLPASDETAWLYARHAAELSGAYKVYVPPFAVVDAILDKQRLWQACAAEGLEVLPSWFPESLAAIPALAREIAFPVLIKPRRHVFRRRREKGVVIASAMELETAFGDFVRRERGDDVTAPNADLTGIKDPSAQDPLPMLQAFVPGAVENVISISGFIDRSGTRTVVSAARKVLQRSRPAGVGLAFEGMPVPDGLDQQALRLCRRLGFFGIFEIEFVQHQGAWRVIDFNPRFYQEMVLDIARGVPLPLLAYYDAIGDTAALDATLAPLQNRARPAMGFSDVFTTTLMLALRAAVNWKATRAALAWHWAQRGRLVDATFDRGDPLPFFAHAWCELRLGLEQFPRILREARLPRSTATPAPAGLEPMPARSGLEPTPESRP
jgi:predicted ATP-grasp superfamily ATP-dependent carboligase